VAASPRAKRFAFKKKKKKKRKRAAVATASTQQELGDHVRLADAERRKRQRAAGSFEGQGRWPTTIPRKRGLANTASLHPNPLVLIDTRALGIIPLDLLV
jgi:hypothetical protein